MIWTEPEFYGPTGGLATALATLGFLKKTGKFPFNGNSRNGNGVKAVEKHVKTVHTAIDSKLSEHDAIFKDLGETQVRQNMILENHETRLNDGKKEFKEVQESIHNIDVSLAVLASKSDERRSTDGDRG